MKRIINYYKAYREESDALIQPLAYMVIILVILYMLAKYMLWLGEVYN